MAADNKYFRVEVAYAETDRQLIIPVVVTEETTLADAIQSSGILEKFPQIDLEGSEVGVFGRVGRLEQKLAPGDRVEIYRPLAQHPMDARRNRAGAR